MSEHKLTRDSLARHATFPQWVFDPNIKRPLVGVALNSGLSFTTLKKTQIFNIEHKNYQFSLFFKILYMLSKGSLNVPEYRRLLIGHVLQLYPMEPAVENIAFPSV